MKSYTRTIEHRQQHSEVMKTWWKDPQNRERLKGKPWGGFRPGHKHSPEIKEKISRGNKGKKRSLETRKKISEVNRLRMQCPEARERLRRAGLLSPEARAKQRESVTITMRLPEQRKLHGDILNSPEVRAKLNKVMQTSEYKEKMRKNVLNRPKQKQCMTDIEILLRDEFKKRRLKFQMWKSMFGRWICDFVFEDSRLIVEADGDYWHNLLGRKESDQRFVEIANANGWNVFRFSGAEITKNASGCARTVARFIRSRKENGHDLQH